MTHASYPEGGWSNRLPMLDTGSSSLRLPFRLSGSVAGVVQLDAWLLTLDGTRAAHAMLTLAAATHSIQSSGPIPAA
jgi:hypothetical protein